MYIVNHRKLEYEFVMIGVGIPFVLPQGHEGNDVQTFWAFALRLLVGVFWDPHLNGALNPKPLSPKPLNPKTPKPGA